MKTAKDGFSIIELVIAVAIMMILAYVALSSYKDYQIRANKEFAKQTLIQNAAITEQFFSQHGSYLNESGNWPGNLITSVIGTNGIAYSITFYPANASSANQQAYCLLAEPIRNSPLVDGKNIYIDRHGSFSDNAPTNCQQALVLNVVPPAPGTCAVGGTYPPCSGDCEGGVWSACSGNCNNVTICAGGTGCSGNCRNSVVYGGCSGNCHDSIIHNGCSGECPNSTIYDGCSGHCVHSTCCDSAGNCSACGKK